MSERDPAGPVWRRYARFFGSRSVADMDDELRFHIEMRIKDCMERGMSEAEARAATAQRLGDMAAARQTCATIATRRDNRMRRAQIIDAFTQDVSFAVRTLGRQKTWTAVAVTTLALGIGANSAMFSVLNTLLLNPVGYPGGSRVALVFQQPSQGNNTDMTVTVTPMGRIARLWRENARSFEALEPYSTQELTIARAGESPRVVKSASVTPTFATLTGSAPLRGRVFTADEAKQNAGVALISEGMWRNDYGASDSIIGQTLSAPDNTSLTIVGVMPTEFQLPRTLEDATDLWLPLDLARAADDGVQLVGRLRPGVSRATAAAELDSILKRSDMASKGNSGRYATVVASPGELVRFKDMLTMLTGAVALVLLIACANVAHLLLARGAMRQREIAIRAALGAGTGRLFRQLVTESVVLSLAGLAGGLLLGRLGLAAIVAVRPASLSSLSVARMDGMTLVVTALIALLTAVVFGVIGAAQASGVTTSEALKSGSLTASQGKGRARARGLLVVTEMALCTLLLVGASLLIRSMMYLQGRDLGFDPLRLYSVRVTLPQERYKTPAAKHAFYADWMARAAAIPGLEGVTVAGAGPMSSSFLVGALQAEGQPDPPAGTTAFINYNGVQPDYFHMMRTRLVAGTTFTDTTDAVGQAVINETMARQLWPGQSALGKRLRVVYAGQGKWRTVVGVAADALTMGRTDRGKPVLYLPNPSFSFAVLARSTSDAAPIRQLAALATSIDSHLAPPLIEGTETAMRRSLARPRFTLLLLGSFSLVALGLAAVGLYGVLCYVVAQRTREIGIRMALGASRQNVARSVLSQGMVLTVTGAALGLVAALWGSRLMTTLLYGVKETDPLSFGVGAAVLLAIAALACLVPMRRALAVDPIIAIRAD